MATEVGICNQALTRLGANTITSLDDNSTEARICKANYNSLRDSVLQEKAWGFNTQRLVLIPDAMAPEWGYAYRFLIPTTVLRVLECRDNPNEANGSQDNFDWRIEGSYIVCDVEKVYVKVAVRENDPGKYSPAFEQTLVARLEAEFAMPLTESDKTEQTKQGKYEQRKHLAGSLDGRQGKPEKTRSNTFKKVR